MSPDQAMPEADALAARPRTLSELRSLIRADLYRYKGDRGILAGLSRYWRHPGFKYTFWLRVSAYGMARPCFRAIRSLFSWKLRRCGVRYGIQIPAMTQIGPGLLIPHFGGIVISEEARIGCNCNLSHDVTIGKANRGARAGNPSIGDNVYIGPGARIMGRITIGSGAAIGANAVVTKDVAENSVVVGVPGRVISQEGSEGYVNWPHEDS